MIVEADVFGDGHDTLACMLGYRHENEADWREVPMTLTVNDRWRGEFPVERLGRYRYTVTAWIDHFLSWRHDFKRRVDPPDIASAALVGSKAHRRSGESRSRGADAQRLARVGQAVDRREGHAGDPAHRARRRDRGARAALSRPALRRGLRQGADASPSIRCARASRAGTSSFPARRAPSRDSHGTFRDVEARLDYVRELGFDVLYLPPIHPIGREKRKGKNNSLTPGAGRRRQSVGDRLR